MVNIENIKQEILKRLEPLNLNQVILFGSYAYGTPHKDSDIDLYVVTNDDYIPKNFDEKMNLKLTVSRAIKDLQKTIPIDVITHTKKMHEKFVAINSSFSREIFQNGVKLYG
jgi:predicted nucleotidyltransferase